MTGRRGKAVRKTQENISIEARSTIDELWEKVMPKEKLSWHRLLFGKQKLDADVSPWQVFQFCIAVVAMTWLAITFGVSLENNTVSWLIVAGISLVLMELYFWVFDYTVPGDRDPMVHTVIRKLWNLLLGTLTTLVLGGAAIFGKQLSIRFGKLWIVYGEFITGLVLWSLFWLVVLAAVLGVLWLFIKLNSLKYKPKTIEPPKFEENINEEDEQTRGGFQ